MVDSRNRQSTIQVLERAVPTQLAVPIVIQETNDRGDCRDCSKKSDPTVQDTPPFAFDSRLEATFGLRSSEDGSL
jgi:hypothetical protein